MDLVIHNPENDNSIAIPVAMAFVLGAYVAMQHCTNSSKNTDSESPPVTPKKVKSQTLPPAPQKPKKKTDDDLCMDLDSDIIRFIATHPGVNAKQILKSVTTTYPELTKTEINSRLYTMMHKKILYKIGEKGAPVWFLTSNNTSTAMILFS